MYWTFSWKRPRRENGIWSRALWATYWRVSFTPVTNIWTIACLGNEGFSQEDQQFPRHLYTHTTFILNIIWNWYFLLFLCGDDSFVLKIPVKRGFSGTKWETFWNIDIVSLKSSQSGQQSCTFEMWPTVWEECQH